MEASIAWSLDLLPGDLRNGFAHLCLFTGGFSDDDARTVAGVDLVGLVTLVEHGLVQVLDESLLRRYRILVPIRDEGRKLPADIAGFQSRLARVISGLSHLAADWGAGGAEIRALGTLWAYVDDALMVLDWYLANAAPTDLADLVIRWTTFWTVNCDATVARNLLAHVAKRIEASGGTVPVEQVAGILYLRGTSAYRAGMFNEAVAILAEAVPVARETGNPRDLTRTLSNLIAVLRESNRFEEAGAYIDEARCVAAAVNAPSFSWLLDYELAMQALFRRDFVAASAAADIALRRAVDLYAPDQPVGVTLALIGHIEMLRGNLDAAGDAYRQSIDRLADRSFETPRYSSIAGQGRVALRKGDLQAASTLLRECLSAQYRRGNPVWTTAALVDCAWLAHLADDDERSATLFGAAGIDTAGDLDLFVADAVGPMLEAVRERLGDHAFANHHRLGRAMHRDEIVAHTLDWLDGIANAGSAIAKPTPSILSRRERDVLALIAEGLSDREIADRLWVSPHTIGTHTKRIYRKLDVNSRTAAVFQGMQLGLIDRQSMS
jgi:ATP/maltotriose-dependent transcriptional regulator MalT